MDIRQQDAVIPTRSHIKVVDMTAQCIAEKSEQIRDSNGTGVKVFFLKRYVIYHVEFELH